MSDGKDPLWSAEGVAHLSDLLTDAEHAIVALRRLLRTYDPALPDAYDGLAWQPIEEPFRP